MITHTDNTQQSKNQPLRDNASQQLNRNHSTFQFVDNRPEVVLQRRIQKMADNHSKNTFQFVDNRPESILQRKLQEGIKDKPLINKKISFPSNAPIQGQFIFTMKGKWDEYDAATLNPGDGKANGDEDYQIISWLEFILKGGIDPDTAEDLSKQDILEIREAIKRLKGITPSMRATVGLGNPSHKSKKNDAPI